MLIITDRLRNNPNLRDPVTERAESLDPQLQASIQLQLNKIAVHSFLLRLPLHSCGSITSNVDDSISDESAAGGRSGPDCVLM